MKSIDEMCAVMQAYKEGKTIEFKDNRTVENEWKICVNPTWNWNYFDYRVKPEPKYVPYDSVSEIDRNKWVRKKDVPNVLRAITMINIATNEVHIAGYCWNTIEGSFEMFEYEDGTPFGKLVKE